MSEKNKELEHLQNLLNYTTPIDLRQMVQRMLFAYLKHQGDIGLDEDFKEIITDCNLLIEFFEKLESND